MAKSLRFHLVIAGRRHTRAHQYRLTAVSAVIQSAARLERGRTLDNVRGREGGKEGGGEGRGGEGDTFHKPEPLWPRSLAGHPRSGWPASNKYSVAAQRLGPSHNC